jgi:ribonuclease J
MSHGFVGPEEEPALLEGVLGIVEEVLGDGTHAVNWSELHETLKDDIARFLHKKTHRRPLVLPVMLEV